MSLLRLVTGLLVVSALSADSQLDLLLRKVESRYNSAKTLQVLFTEQYTAGRGISQPESGVLDLRKPGRMRWEYSQPKGKLWVSDGKFHWLYNPAENRVEKMKLKDSEDMHAPLAFLLGKLHFDKDFRNLKATQEGSDTRVTGEPSRDDLQYSAVEFVVTFDDRIKELKVTGYDHSILKFTFDQEKLNPPLDEKLFRFKMPPGATLEEESGQ